MALLAACGQPAPAPDAVQYDLGVEVDTAGFRAAEPATIAAQQAVASSDFMTDERDFDLARRGLLATETELDIRGPNGEVVWRPADYAFLDVEPPATANPSLWRQARLNNIHGLFEVVPGIYQVRGYDLSNMSIIETESGRIIIDPLTSVETARAALDLVERELGAREIVAIVLTHSHIDHFGGIAAIASREELDSGEIEIIAPDHFLEEAVSENVLAGAVMSRRAGFMYGMPLPRSPRGHIGSGLGKHPAIGTHSIAAPTRTITRTGERMTIDGVELVFQYAPHTEAPAELTIFLPQFNAWCGAEIVSRSMHNLYTLRGAQVRDAVAWSAAIDDALHLFGDQTDVIFNSHHWPVWGREESRTYLEAQRDIYKYIHDQTLRLASQGLTPDEIAETIALPPELENVFSIRGYYGTLRHNARAVYQRYFGWYDGVPAHLNPVPRSEAAARYVDGFGGLEATLALAQTAFDAGDFRWAAELQQHAVFAEPGSAVAREALARSYEQMGYQAESGPWRDNYLSGAHELRHGVEAVDAESAADDILNSIPLDMFFSAMATRLDGVAAGDRELAFNFRFTDVDETYLIEISNGVMRHYEDRQAEQPDATVTLTRAFWMRLISDDAGLVDMIASQEFAVEGDRAALLGFFTLLQDPQTDFPIVTP
ncbi:alkyl sulfatase dimerization domain-containing protein [Maricaulis sp.]|uniref:alkyl/aryl-sulfatase n=1 Tax=Maricaulis sp. TaxID=1486257 RepID=UPI00260A9AF4|nr:alkyl sulfatase dimerization domain-containing protein [Maricaulis sp.]